MPELKLPLLFGIFGSAFCATLNHYYDEIRPFLVGLGWGLQTVDDLITQVRRYDPVKASRRPLLKSAYRGEAA